MQNFQQNRAYKTNGFFDFGTGMPKICEISHDFHCENLRKKWKSAEKAVL